MADNTQIARMSAAILLFVQREHLLDDYRAAIGTLKRHLANDREIIGECNQLEAIDGHFASATKRLEALRDAPCGDYLEGLEETLAHVDWEVCAHLLVELRLRLDECALFEERVRTSANGWAKQIEHVEEVLRDAKVEHASIAALAQKLKAATARLTRVRTVLADDLYRNLSVQQYERDCLEMTAFEEYAAAVKLELPRLKALVQRADLLIMRAGRSQAGDYVYHVLLRSESPQQQMRGISIIQGTQTLSAGERDEFVGSLLKSVRHALSRTVRTLSENERPESAQEADDAAKQLQALGAFLWRMVIPDSMQPLLRNQTGSLTITTNDLSLPWELMCMDEAESTEPASGAFLCLAKPIARMPLGDTFPRAGRVRVRGKALKRRMLLVHSDRCGTLFHAQRECDTIEKKLRGVVDIVRLKPEEATTSSFTGAIVEGFDFIHYAGHGLFDEETPSRSGLCLQDGTFDAEHIRKLNRGGSLVFLNACEAGALADAATPQPIAYLLSKPHAAVGLASSFIYSGAVACVGPLWVVNDDAAAELAVGFYKLVLEGEPVGEALRAARADVRKRFPSACTWAAYLLYGDPTFRLTEFEQPSAEEA